MEPESLLPCSQQPATDPYPELRPLQRIRPVPKACVAFRNKLFVTVRRCQSLAQPSSWSTTYCQLSVTDYSVYSQLLSISGVRLLYPQTENAPCRCDRELNIRGCIKKFPDWPPGARTANGTTVMPLGSVVSLFCESVL
jgi:hypothetical protein